MTKKPKPETYGKTMPPKPNIGKTQPAKPPKKK